MTLTSPAVFVADDENDLLARIRESASSLVFSPRGTVRCWGMPLFRTQASRDLACLLDVDPAVESWTCLPMVLHHAQGMHMPDFAVVWSTGTALVDALSDGASASSRVGAGCCPRRRLRVWIPCRGRPA